MSRKKHWRLSRRTRRILLDVSLAMLAVFILGNAVLWAAYHGRTYPRTTVMGLSIGSVSYNNLSQKVSQEGLLPQKLEFTHGGQKTQVGLSDLGISKDVNRTTRSANKQRSWLPALNLFKTSELQAPIRIDNAKLDAKASDLAKTLRKDPVNARLTLNGINVGIAKGQDGYELQQRELKETIFKNLDAGKTTIAAPVSRTTPKVQASSLKAEQTELQEQLKTPITYRFNGKTKQVTATDIAGWFVVSGETYVVAPDKLQAYIAQVGKDFGIRIKDIHQVAVSTQQALVDHKALDLTLVQQIAAKTYVYCVAAKGVDATYLPAFRSKLQATLNDKRGWSLDGLVEFKEGSSGCGFTAWLTAAELMPTFSTICDAMWSCRVGPNVVINFTRWQNASPAWNAAGGALEEYRNMVINHEVGHWLSFGHLHCAGPGQPAPVMQQQSIDLEGCAFSAWPNPGELASLRTKLGI